MMISRKWYSSDVSNDEWSLVVAYLPLMRVRTRRQHSLRELFTMGGVTCGAMELGAPRPTIRRPGPDRA
jgi:hypothetical protein